jgi:uncharacterized RDD family membrane protein YckC
MFVAFEVHLVNDDNPYGLPPVPPPNSYPGPQYGGPFGSPFGPQASPPPPPNPFAPPPPPPSNPFATNPYPQNPYAPPSIGAQGPVWAQFGQVQLPLASPGARLGAHILDGFVYFGALLLMGLPAVALGPDASTVLAVLGFFGVSIYQWYLLSTTGQSIGKKLLRIRVVKVDGSPVDFVSAVLLRSWAFFALVVVGSVLVIGAILPLVDALMIFGDEHRCLRDHLAGTKVVEVGDGSRS